MARKRNVLDLSKVIGADEASAIQRLTLYIPSKDRHGRGFDAKPWVDRALKLLSGIGGGATALPPVDGAWLNPETSVLVTEKVVLAYTFIDPDKFEDRYESALTDLIRAKQAGKPPPKPSEPKPSNVINLMDALRRSVKAGKGSEKTAVPARSARASQRRASSARKRASPRSRMKRAG